MLRSTTRTACAAFYCAQVRERLVNVLGDVCVRVPRPLLTVWLQLAALSAKFNGHPSGTAACPLGCLWKLSGNSLPRTAAHCRAMFCATVVGRRRSNAVNCLVSAAECSRSE